MSSGKELNCEPRERKVEIVEPVAALKLDEGRAFLAAMREFLTGQTAN